MPATEPRPKGRLVVVGRNSRVWQRLEADRLIGDGPLVAVGHAGLDALRLTPEDVVWVLSYSRRPEENRALLVRLATAAVRRIVYVSTATAIVADATGCYEYPRVKRQAETMAFETGNAAVVRIGVMVADAAELPGGETAATTYAELAGAMRASLDAPPAAGSLIHLWRMVPRPFSGTFEQALHAIYGVAIGLAGPWPCLLRPVDFVLRALGYRWYGYVFLGNRSCRQITSSSAPA
jgi:hypothetical protein